MYLHRPVLIERSERYVSRAQCTYEIELVELGIGCR
jgi:hypothetical protein